MKLPVALLAPALALAVPAAARADATVELDAGGGADTSAPGGFATAHAALGIEATRAATPLLGRGLYLGTTDGGLWVFTGLDPDDRDGAGASVDATASAGAAGRALVLDARAWARDFGWELALDAALQPIGDLRDRFWRSGRGVAQLDVTLDVPAMWALGSARTQLLVGLSTVTVGARRADDSPAGFDRDVAFTGMRVQSARTRVDVFGLDVFELGVARQTIGAITYGTSASGFDFDLARVAYRPREGLELDASGGVALRSPLGPFMATGTSETSTGPVGARPRYWLELRATPDAHRTLTLGAGSWIRLDPTGHAVDAGQLAALSLARDLRFGQLRASLEGGRLTRIALGELAPSGLPPLGTRRWMGRASLEAAIRVAPDVGVVASAWLERSDRDDPRWLVPASGAVATHAGGDLSLRWRHAAHL